MRAIAAELGIDVSTISRELKRTATRAAATAPVRARVGLWARVAPEAGEACRVLIRWIGRYVSAIVFALATTQGLVGRLQIVLGLGMQHQVASLSASVGWIRSDVMRCAGQAWPLWHRTSAGSLGAAAVDSFCFTWQRRVGRSQARRRGPRRSEASGEANAREAL